MYKILFISDSHKHFDSAICEYQKRLGKNIELLNIKPVKTGNIIEKETDLLIAKLSKLKGFKIVLNPSGNLLDTTELYNFLESKKLNFPSIVFIIGGANGIDYKKLDSHIYFSLSLGKTTMPHSLAFLVLIEQIYRIIMINKGTSYNK